MRLLAGLAALLVAAASSTFAGSSGFWPRLTTLKIDRCCFGDVQVRYDPRLATVINETEFIPPDSDMKTVHAIRTTLAPGSPLYVVDYWEGASCDPTFLIYDATKTPDRNKPLLEVSGLTLSIPGDGFVYVHGHTNNFFSQFRKFIVTPKHAEEVAQPFYYAGIETRTTTPIKLVTAPSSTEVISELASGTRVTILACQKDDWCLVRDALGLIGWTKLEYSRKPDAQFRGVFYAGD